MSIPEVLWAIMVIMDVVMPVAVLSRRRIRGKTPECAPVHSWKVIRATFELFGCAEDLSMSTRFKTTEVQVEKLD